MEFPQSKTDFMPLDTLMMEAVAPKAIMAALERKLFDHFSEKGMTAAELAVRAGLVAGRLEPLLDILTAVGLAEKKRDKYVNSPVAEEFLVSTSPLYQGDYLALTMRFTTCIEQSLDDLLAGGKMEQGGMGEHWSTGRAMDGAAQNALWAGAGALADVAASLPGFDSFRTMCDIGGNHGLYTLGVLDRNPALSGSIFDLPSVVEQSAQRCAKSGYGERVDIVGFDFRKETLPKSQYDLALASHFLYAFKDDLAGALRKIAHGLKPGGWFISHHYCGSAGPKHALRDACLELVTRLSGHPSHVIRHEELKEALDQAGFGEVRFNTVPGREMSLLTSARKL